MKKPDDLIPFKEAGDLLGVSKNKMTSLVKDGHLKAYTTPVNRRFKYVSRAEVLKLKDKVELAA